MSFQFSFPVPLCGPNPNNLVSSIIIIFREILVSGLRESTKSEELMNTENLVRRDIRQGMDPQEAYKKYNAF